MAFFVPIFCPRSSAPSSSTIGYHNCLGRQQAPFHARHLPQSQTPYASLLLFPNSTQPISLLPEHQAVAPRTFGLMEQGYEVIGRAQFCKQCMENWYLSWKGNLWWNKQSRGELHSDKWGNPLYFAFFSKPSAPCSLTTSGFRHSHISWWQARVLVAGDAHWQECVEEQG